MNTGIRRALILVVIGLMMASASIRLTAATPSGQRAQSSTELMVPPNSYFSGILATSVSQSMANSTFFAPFSYNPLTFNITGKFLSFIYSGASQNQDNIAIYDVHVNETPFSNVSRVVYSQYQVLSTGGLVLGHGVIGSIFYAYTNNTMLIAHDNPQALIQVFSYGASATVQAILSQGLQPNSKYTISPSSGTTATTNGTVAVMFNDTQLAGYFVSEGSDFTEAHSTGGIYSVTKRVLSGSYINSFSVPSGDSDYASTLSIIAQGMRHNTISYYAAVTMQGGQAAYDGAYFNNALRVQQMTVSRGDIQLQMTAMQPGMPNTVVLLVSSSIFNGSISSLSVEVNGRQVVNSSSLPSIVAPYGNSTLENTTSLGSYTIITVYSPGNMASLHIYVPASGQTGSLAAFVLPFVSAALLIGVASVLLFRRKRDEGQ